MLTEIANVKQITGEKYRRWFSSSFFQLIVWYSQKGGEIFGFQLCYDIYGKERAFTWIDERGSFHHTVNDGDILDPHKQTPLLTNGGFLEKEELLNRFKEEATSLNPIISSLIQNKIETHIN